MNPLIDQARKVRGFESTPRWYVIWRFHDNLILRTRAECIICGEYISEVSHDRYHLKMPRQCEISFFDQIAKHALIHQPEGNGTAQPQPEAGGSPETAPSGNGHLGVKSQVKPDDRGVSTAPSPPGQRETEPPAKPLLWYQCVRCGASQKARHAPDACLSIDGGGCGRADTGFHTIEEPVGPPCLTCGKPSTWLASRQFWVHCGRRADA